VWLKRREIKSQFLKFFYILVVITKKYLCVKGLIMYVEKGLNTLTLDFHFKFT